VLALQPAEAAAERQTRDPDVRGDAARGGEPEGGGRTVEFPDRQPWLHAGRLSRGVDVTALHRGKIDHQAALVDRLAGDVVAAAADGDLEPFVLGEIDRSHDVGRVQAARDHRRMLVDQAVVNPARFVVTGLAGLEDRRERLTKKVNGIGSRSAGHHRRFSPSAFRSAFRNASG
jgi:hypothetical protein